MYHIGDKIVYPMHGAGIIEEIQEETILGEQRQYYVLNVSGGGMKVMIPVDRTEQIGVRDIISTEEMDHVIEVLGDDTTAMPGNWNRRYRQNMEKLKTGAATEVAEVVRNLMRTERSKKLSTGEKKMLSNARQILMSEMILVKGIDSDHATLLIDEAV